MFFVISEEYIDVLISLDFVSVYHQICFFFSLQHDAELFLESVSVKLVVLRGWKKTLEICSSWLASAESGSTESYPATEPSLIQGLVGLSLQTEEPVDFRNPSSVKTWAEEGFVVAVDHAQKLQHHLEAVHG